ncbi:MAG: hypothetical protein JXB06_05835 [Spirochaetales bacterium]|nr:hypothetical protein [Spirochaetales bacterium]
MNWIHLICNAHLDPVWLWEWQEGAAEALSTFRTAADFCDEYGGFVFNHNEALLYRWIEEYDPGLFARIRDLVRGGRWHIMGGWFLQPDCNLPCGESLVRQILAGRRYFHEKFGAQPTTAINFDPFGHSRGLVQILARAGYDSYIFCRPRQDDMSLPAEDFYWVGYDGSRILAHRASEYYMSHLGQAAQKIRSWIRAHRGREVGMVLWGMGDHGGGPSRVDLEEVEELIRRTSTHRLLHSTPEAYFRQLRRMKPELPSRAADLNPWAAGCYTSQIRIKQTHRRLESELYATEKMLSQACLLRLLEYPGEDVERALYDLLLSEFHDILPGSSIAAVEQWALRLMGHALEILGRLKARAFFALSSNQRRASEGEFPILIYNPHPFPLRGIWECEFQLADQNRGEGWHIPSLVSNGRQIPCQLEQEASNLNMDWRKRIAFYAELEPARMNRFDCSVRLESGRPKASPRSGQEKLIFKTADLEVHINARTGLVDRYSAGGIDYLREGSFRPIVIADDADPWGSRSRSFRKEAGCFELMDRETAAEFCGEPEPELQSLRVVEEGEVRTVVQALLRWGRSAICQEYRVPKRGTELEITLRVYWNEKDKMLKLAIPTLLGDAECLGQVTFGIETLRDGGEESVIHRWVALLPRDRDGALACINDGIYAADWAGGQLRLSLLRSPAYSALPLPDRPFELARRFIPRIDQGERCFTFWLLAGRREELMDAVDSIALARNEPPCILSFQPGGEAHAGGATHAGGAAKEAGAGSGGVLQIDDPAVRLAAFKAAESRRGYVLRLFESTGRQRTANLTIPPVGIRRKLDFGPFELKSLLLDPEARTLMEIDLLEREI